MDMESPGSVDLGSDQEFSFGGVSCEMPVRTSEWNVKWPIGYSDIYYVKWDVLDS